ncbi:MAG: type 1 glutamine amidotransferase [Candidatus Nomurabacteria bacterium]|jgi:GMP synthase (glutamine-hydrolysing)|nr:type 1 glutamine amidotransferase [Candidatus Nomurabacteria bacterium]
MKKVLIIANWENRAPDIRRSLLKVDKSLKISTYHAFLREEAPTVAKFDAFIISGGPMGVYQINKSPYDFVLAVVELTKQIIASNKPLLGICFGHQLIAQMMGGLVVRDEAKEEIGWTKMAVLEPVSPLLKDVPREFETFMYHTDRVAAVPKGAKVLMKSGQVDVGALEYLGKPIFSVQFHPEYDESTGNAIYASEGHPKAVRKVSETWERNRQQILANFLKMIGIVA